LNNPKTKREIACEKEEECEFKNNTPSIEQMHNIILELAFKCNSLERKMEEMQKSGSYKKPKINYLEWLNTNITPIYQFKEWADALFVGIDEDMDILMDSQNMGEIMMRIVGRGMCLNETAYTAKNLHEYPHSMICLDQKFYIYHLDEWILCPTEQFILFARIIHSKLFNHICVWSKKHAQMMNENEQLDDLYNKTLTKITRYSFAPESSDMNKFRGSLVQYMKVLMVE